MKKFLKSLFISAAVMAVVSPLSQAQVIADPIKREFRSVWISAMGVDFSSWTTVDGIQQAIVTALDNSVTGNYTSACFHVRPMADALYKSELAPWSIYSGSAKGYNGRGVNPGWDPLQYAITQAHSRGLELHAWLNPLRVASNNTFYAGNTTKDYDEVWENKGWIIKENLREDGNIKEGDYLYTLNPGIPEVRDHIVAVVEEILLNYDVDGIIFDDYFYPNYIGEGDDSTAEDYSTYLNSGTTLSIDDWRRENINKMIAEVYAKIQELRPDVRFGVSPAGVSGNSATKHGFPTCPVNNDWQYEQIFSDPLAWLSEKSIDYISPQLYWDMSHAQSVGVLSPWWSQCAKLAGRHNYPSFSSSNSVSSTTTVREKFDAEEYEYEIKSQRNGCNDNAPGFIMFAAKGIATHMAHLVSTVLGNPVLQPEITWRTDKRYEFSAPANVKKSGSTLSWTAQSKTFSNGENRIVKYTVYAVPDGMELSEAQSNDGDGISSQYLLGVTYSNSYTIPSGKTSGYWYAVCVYDGFSKEWEPGFYGYTPKNPGIVATLASPVDGSTVDTKNNTFVTFQWESDPVDSYTLEVSKTADFATIHQSKTVTAKEAVIDANLLGIGTFYWRVKTNKADHLTGESAQTWTFTIETLPPPPTPWLDAPAHMSTIGPGKFNFEWHPKESNLVAESYTLEVSGTSDWEHTMLKVNTADTKYASSCEYFGVGTFYWRVIAHKTGFDDVSSTWCMFTVDEINTGDSETDYTITTDGHNSSYNNVETPNGRVGFTSQWIRSVDVSGSLSRDFIAHEDYLYIIHRSESGGGTLSLLKFNRHTGERIGTIAVSGANDAPYPLNDIMKDSKGNVLVANMATRTNSATSLTCHPIKIRKLSIDNAENTATAADVISLPLVNRTAATDGASAVNDYRHDHCGVYGDFDGTLYVFAATATFNKVVRWKVVNKTAQDPEVTTLSALYPTSSANLGMAPIVVPVSADEFYVDGAGTALTRYKFTAGSNAVKTGSFGDNNCDIAPGATSLNGGVAFTFNGQNYIGYPYSGSASTKASSPWKFQIANVNANWSYPSMVEYWTFPDGDNFGIVAPGDGGGPMDYMANNDGTGTVYAYVPGTGIAAYKLRRDDWTGVEGSFADGKEVAVTFDGKCIRLDADATVITLYNLAGVPVVTGMGSSLYVDVTPGFYVVRAIVDGNTITKSIVIR